jgi:hypothetical protein
MTDFTYDQLSALHEAMCLAFHVAPRTSDANPAWPLVWDGESPPPWKPLWSDFISTLDLTPFPQGDYYEGRDIAIHLHQSLRLGTPSWRHIIQRPLLWEHIWIVKQYLNEVPDPRDEEQEISYSAGAEESGPGSATEDTEDTEDTEEWGRTHSTCIRALNLLDSVMSSDDRVLSEQVYVELCNALKELYDAS